MPALDLSWLAPIRQAAPQLFDRAGTTGMAQLAERRVVYHCHPRAEDNPERRQDLPSESRPMPTEVRTWIVQQHQRTLLSQVQPIMSSQP